MNNLNCNFSPQSFCKPVLIVCYLKKKMLKQHQKQKITNNNKNMQPTRQLHTCDFDLRAVLYYFLNFKPN